MSDHGRPSHPRPPNVQYRSWPVCHHNSPRPRPPSVPAFHPNSPPSVAACLILPAASQQVVAIYPHPLLVLPSQRHLVLPAARQDLAGHPHPPSVTGGRGPPSSSSQRHGRSWPAILVLSASREIVDGHPHPPSVTGGRGWPSSSSQRHGRLWLTILILSASQEVVDGHPRPLGVTGSCGRPSPSSRRHERSWTVNLPLRPRPSGVTAGPGRPSSSSQRRGLAVSYTTVFVQQHRRG